MQKAFTLIELLVVILVIGILAAIALPQYRLAVAKSQLTAVIPTVKAMKEAAEVYYLAHGEYKNQMNVYDLTLPCQTGSFCTHNMKTYDVCTRGGFCSWDTAIILLAADGNAVNSYGICLSHSNKPNQIYCGAQTDNTLANKVCLSMGGVLATTNKCTNGGKYTPCNLYTLPN